MTCLILGCLSATPAFLAGSEETNAYPRISEQAFKARLPFFDYDKSIPLEGRMELAPPATAKVALIHVGGDADKVVPPEENTLILEQRYKELGGKIMVIHKPGCDHHPHGLDNPQPIVDFVLEHAR